MNEVYVLQRRDRKRNSWRFLTSVQSKEEAVAFLQKPHKERPHNYRAQRFIPIEEFIDFQDKEHGT